MWGVAFRAFLERLVVVDEHNPSIFLSLFVSTVLMTSGFLSAQRLICTTHLACQFQNRQRSVVDEGVPGKFMVYGSWFMD